MKNTAENIPEYQRLGAFMSGPDLPTYAQMISFFSTSDTPGVKNKYLHPRELEKFRESLSSTEWYDFKVEFWDHLGAEVADFLT